MWIFGNINVRIKHKNEEKKRLFINNKQLKLVCILTSYYINLNQCHFHVFQLPTNEIADTDWFNSESSRNVATCLIKKYSRIKLHFLMLVNHLLRIKIQPLYIVIYQDVKFIRSNFLSRANGRHIQLYFWVL